MTTSSPRQLADHTTVLGTDHFRHFLVGEHQDVMIECGVTESARHVVKQMADSGGHGPDKLLVTHAHFDHVCGIPLLKHHFPHAEVLASSVAARVLDNPTVVTGFFDQDRQIPKDPAMDGSEADTDSLPRQDRISVDRIVSGGEHILLKGGSILELMDAPGHSPCGLAAWYEKDRVLFVSDALGFQISDDTIFPLFFHAFGPYMETIRKLKQYPAGILAIPHERIWRGKDVADVFSRALSTAQELRDTVIAEADKGRDLLELEQMLFDTCYQENLRIYTPENIRLCVKLLVRRSLESR
ncbi:MBL fold metallo-hydrolase [Desulfosarcina sp. OttesenSCG-928-A07]|nr:MBL fold metallo-hydrolase [Desulfosarcina sp. OttesenSCG-928-G17]MDL2330108.1 MBL fold metallo-hydrolase [Desulfosarcina sp. OttesenSCG-928-A07]